MDIVSLVHHYGARAHTELNSPFLPPRESFSALRKPDNPRVLVFSAGHTAESEYYSRSGVESLHKRSAGADAVGFRAFVPREVAYMQAPLWRRKARGFRPVVPRRQGLLLSTLEAYTYIFLDERTRVRLFSHCNRYYRVMSKLSV